MSSSKNNTTYKKTSFLAGNNSEFINEFYLEQNFIATIGKLNY